MKKPNCHDCDAKVGEAHQVNCDVARCPFCGGQLLSCDCMYEQMGERFGWTYKPTLIFDIYKVFETPVGYKLINVFPDGRAVYEVPCNGLPEDIYNGGPTDEMTELWEAILQEEGLSRWTGKWPGEAECEEWGWYSYWDPKYTGNEKMHCGHIPCDKDHPGATANLNRLYDEAVWSREEKRFVLKDSDEGREILAEKEKK